MNNNFHSLQYEINPMKNTLTPKISLVLSAPSTHTAWVLIPISYTLFIQLITGIPHPRTFERFENKGFFAQVSTQLYDYPFWLQDLSHLPIFFTLYWLWAWFLKKKNKCFQTMDLCFWGCFLYSILNEMIQFFVPYRFPSIGDMLMNILGIFLAVYVYKIFWKFMMQ